MCHQSAFGTYSHTEIERTLQLGALTRHVLEVRLNTNFILVLAGLKGLRRVQIDVPGHRPSSSQCISLEQEVATSGWPSDVVGAYIAHVFMTDSSLWCPDLSKIRFRIPMVVFLQRKKLDTTYM